MHARLFPTAALLLAAASSALAADNGLLFYLSGDKQTTADLSAGNTPEPTLVRGVTVIPDGAKGPGLQCANTQVLAYWAPGNIYSQRGTLSFSWRSRYAVGPTAFPIFRVAYSDSSTWDMAWLRIDYNGHGFDAFVTDASLARTRVSIPLDPFSAPNQWTHLALAWDETKGIRFYVNGKLAAENPTAGRFDTGLDQFGPHSRIISPHQVQSDYNFIRGGDIDEVRIYDRMLDDPDIATLAKGDAPANLQPLPARSLDDARTKQEWYFRYGWNRPGDPPPELPEGPAATIRKVEIHEAFDLKRWWWKANDGLRETTWPGVYNRSRLPGRTDYFTLPDWDCYSVSGKAITFLLPDEPWNHIEISGSAWGKMDLLSPDAPLLTETNDPQLPALATLFERPQAQEKTVHALATRTAGKIRFTNAEIEDPIGEMSVYNVTAAAEPAGSAKRAFRLTATPPANLTAVAGLATFIHDRYPPDERATLYAAPATANPPAPAPATATQPAPALPLVHILIPNSWDDLDAGLDGIAIDLPALAVKPTHGPLFPLNIQVKDPTWMPRDMLDFTFSVRPNQPKTLWLDLRDRLLPAGNPLYLTIAAAGQDFTPAMLEGAQLRLIFKPKEAARPEHELDRFTQAKDSYAMLVEEHPKSPRLNLWVRFETDLTDLLRVNPQHVLGRQYAAAAGVQANRPDYTLPAIPPSTPAWAARQVQLLDRVKHFVDWYIDNRQITNGEFGGGLSDDTDLTNTWPGVALMGADPDKLTLSLHKELEACFNNRMFTAGLPTIQVDELHSYEEGINCLAQNMILDFGNPRQIERAMETQKGLERITAINPAGHRLFKTSYYSATKIATEAPWGGTKGYSYLVTQPGELLVDFNGNPEAKKLHLELADGLLAHRDAARGTTAETIDFQSDQADPAGRRFFPWHVFWTAYQWTGDKKYLDALSDGGQGSLASINPNALDILGLRSQWTAPAAGARGGRGGGGGGHLAWQLTGNKQSLETLYASQIQSTDLLNYINTEGSLWIDRVNVPITDIQRARLGGVALVRNSLFPGHTVGWQFHAPASDQSVAILIPDATRTSFKVIAYNLDAAPITATMTGANIDPGMWEMTQGIDADNDDIADGTPAAKALKFERSASVDLTFPPHATTVLTFKLKTPGTPYWQRPDLGICTEDVLVTASALKVTVHSIGSVDAPAARLRLLDKDGKELAAAPIPALKAPLDLVPVRNEITLPLPANANLTGATVQIDSAAEEITQRNNRVHL